MISLAENENELREKVNFCIEYKGMRAKFIADSCGISQPYFCTWRHDASYALGKQKATRLAAFLDAI